MKPYLCNEETKVYLIRPTIISLWLSKELNTWTHLSMWETAHDVCPIDASIFI